MVDARIMLSPDDEANNGAYLLQPAEALDGSYLAKVNISHQGQAYWRFNHPSFLQKL